jgi:SAM-dependent methyltransferase
MSKMTHAPTTTLTFYDTNASDYSGARPDIPSPDLLAFLPRLAPGSRILELGCGAGRDAAEMIAMGFDVDPTDGSPAMAALAAQRLGRPVRVLRFGELVAHEAYDAVVACASLLHVNRADLRDVLRRVHAALRPGGWHFASYKTGEAEGPDAHGRYYNQPSRADADRLYRAAGDWASLDYDEYDGTGYFSAPCRWLTVAAQK